MKARIHPRNPLKKRVTAKKTGLRSANREIGVYTVADRFISREEFLYSTDESPKRTPSVPRPQPQIHELPAASSS